MNSMNILINTYKHLNDPIYYTVSGKLRHKDMVIRENLNYDNLAANDIYTEIHKKNTLECIKLSKNSNEFKRVYKSVLEFKYDSAFDIEMLGIERYSKEHTVLFSLQDSLDFVLNQLCGVDTELVRRIPNYQRISRGLLNIDVEMLGQANFGELIGIDPRLDNYIARMDSSALDYADFILKFFGEITECCNALLHKLAMQYQCFYKEQGKSLSLKSKNISSVVFASEIPVDDAMEILEDYFILIKSYKRLEYGNHVADLCIKMNNIITDMAL